MNFFTRNRVVLLILAIVMSATRLYHFGALPDASWAILFLGGFYLGSPLAFLVLMLEAVAIDYVATQHTGVNSYCLSPAYLMLLPAYASLWFGGARARRLWHGMRPLGVVGAGGIVLASLSLCFLLSNGSFYWLSGRVAAPNIAGWFAHFRHWYSHFVLVPCAYVGLAALAHASCRWLRPAAHRMATRLSRQRKMSESTCA